MIRHHLGPQPSVWIMQVSLFSSVLINRFHCIYSMKELRGTKLQYKAILNLKQYCLHYYVALSNIF